MFRMFRDLCQHLEIVGKSSEHLQQYLEIIIICSEMQVIWRQKSHTMYMALEKLAGIECWGTSWGNITYGIANDFYYYYFFLITFPSSYSSWRPVLVTLTFPVPMLDNFTALSQLPFCIISQETFSMPLCWKNWHSFLFWQILVPRFSISFCVTPFQKIDGWEKICNEGD